MFTRLAILTTIAMSLLLTTLAMLVIGARSTDRLGQSIAYTASLLAALLFCICLGRWKATYGRSWASKLVYVRDKRLPGPCPHCGEPLRTATATYCRFCNMDWRDPNDVHKRTTRNVSWWPGPLPPEIERLNREQQLIIHCRFPIFERNRDEIMNTAVAAARDFRSFLSQQLDDALASTEPSIEIFRQFYAAGLLTYGDIEMVEVILNNMPEGVSPKAATGYCVAAPSNILSRLLPLPDSLKADGVHSVVDAVQVREWFEKHRSDLRWDAASERFHVVTQQPT